MGICDSVAGAATSCGIEIEKRLEGCLLPHFKYLIYSKRYEEKLKDAVDTLTARIKDADFEMQDATRNFKKPSSELERWLDIAKKLETKAHKCLNQSNRKKDTVGLEADPHIVFNPAQQRANVQLNENQKELEKRSLCGMCRHCAARYKLGKKAVQLKKEIFEHYAAYENVNKAAYSIPPKETRLSGYLEGLQSMDFHKRGVIEALQNKDIDIIGVQGMPGVGKSTLMKSVCSDLKVMRLFEQVIMITVSRDPDIKKIQDGIAKKLGFGFEDQDCPDDRQEKLHQKLVEGKKYVIVLDDVWKASDFERIGIPKKYKGDSSKIVLTTRDEQVCREMGACLVKMEALPKEESWILFKWVAGGVVDHDEIKCIAEKVCNECAGLPLAIKVVASYLKGNDRHTDWDCYLYKLQNMVVKDKEFEEKVFIPLKLSYDHLRKDERLFFMYCSMFPEDHAVHADMLMRYLIGEGVLEGERKVMWLNSLHLMNRLGDLGLLILEDGDLMRMHDVVRDFAVDFIGSKGEGSSGDVPRRYTLYVKAGKKLEKWPAKMRIEETDRISFMYNAITSLPDMLGSKKLRTLLLQNNDPLKIVPENFFLELSNLLILDMSGTSISSLPSSIQHLKNLKVLHLDYCYKLAKKDIALVGELQELEVLSFRRAHIHELPREIGKLRNLRILDFSYSHIEVINPNILSSLSQLEELQMFRSFSGWAEECKVVDNQKIELAKFSELATLKELAVLYLTVGNENHFFETEKTLCFMWEKLSFFCITCGKNPSFFGKMQSIELVGKMHEQIPLAQWVKSLLCKTEDLILESLYFQSIMKNDTGSDFKHLKYLRISSCPKMEYLVRTSTTRRAHISTFTNISDRSMVLANLERLELNEMHELMMLCDGTPSDFFLCRLRGLKIKDCNKMDSLFPSYLVCNLQNLEEITVEDCGALAEIFQYEFGPNSITLAIAPKLSSICLSQLPNLRNVFNDGTGRVRSIPLRSFRNLKHMILADCGTLRSIFPPHITECLSRLEVLSVSCCEIVEVLIDVDEGGDVPDMQLFPNLIELRLEELPWMKGICYEHLLAYGTLKLTWSSLQDLRISGCSNLAKFQFEDITSPERLDKINLNNKECWFHGLISKNSPCGTPSDQQFPKSLKRLDLRDFNITRKLFPFDWIHKLHNLESLRVSECKALLDLFDFMADGDQHVVDMELFPNLKQIQLWHLPSMKSIFPKQMEANMASHTIDNRVAEALPMGTFGNLQYLRMLHCDALTHIFTPRIADCLVNLERLVVISCSSIEAIVKDDVGGQMSCASNCRKAEDIAVGVGSGYVIDDLFPRLKFLYLESLPRINSICLLGLSTSLPLKLKWPSLKELDVQSCPHLRQLHIGSESAPQLQSILGSESWFHGLELDDDSSRAHLQNFLILEQV